MTNLALINFSGNTGKTTLAKHLFSSRMPGAFRIAFETINTGDDTVDEKASAEMFQRINEAMNNSDADFIVDIGASNVEKLLERISATRGSHKDFDYYVIPTTCAPKIKIDTVNTIKRLKQIGVDPKRIIVIANLVDSPDTFDKDFQIVLDTCETLQFQFCKQAILASDLFAQLPEDKTVAELAAEDEDELTAKIKQTPAQTQERNDLIKHRSIVRMSKYVHDNLQSVWDEMPFANEFAKLEIETA